MHNMKTRVTRTIIITLASLWACSTFSQDFVKHEFSAWGAGGLSALKQKMEINDSKSKRNVGGNLGLGYSYLFNKSIGVNTGFEFALYISESHIDILRGKEVVNDGYEDFEFRYTVNNYKESQNATYLNIPIMVQYQLQTSSKYSFYGALGAKIGIPISSKYKVKDSKIKTVGFYEEYGEGALVEGPTFRGLGSFEGASSKRNLDLKMAYMLSMEAGVKYSLPKQLSLYSGFYFDYGLNDINKQNSDKSVFLGYNEVNPEEFITNSIFTSQYQRLGKEKAIVTKVVPMAIGLKVRLAFLSFR